ncbi:flagellar filament capping protein FliD [Paenibacillus pabuli]|uniref:flagellar filament capping protein FliD n=1 Tax=Paenibacillus pabuli TaxID=1472 RepID=UPI001FFE8D6B|nr:flagellar filament capping protein FliD [Paenibacillus pabuli]UPK43468.1 flagellar filament capping protein FliD [Paenibacillus pabuli]
MRVSGLSSGMDVDNIVKQMMTAQRVPLDKLNQKKQTLDWKRDMYKQVNSQLVDFRNNKLSSYKTTASMNAFKATVSGDTAAISVKASPIANQLPMKVTVSQLATQTSMTSTDKIGSKALTLNQLQSGEDSFNLTVKRGSKETNITFQKGDTVEAAIRKINTSDANVSAAYDESTGNITIKSNEYGKSNITFEGNILQAFNLTANATPGDNAKVKINNEDLEYTSNKFTINGVEVTLQAKSEPGKESLITTSVDSTKIVETIKSFIADYNATLELINGKLSEERYRDYSPLTDEQKKEMSEDDIKLWENKAKSGLLRNDGILEKVVSDMRNAVVGASIGGTSTFNLSSLGITTGQYYEGGKLKIADEDKLQKAIEENPDRVIELFNGSPDGKYKGLFNDIYDKTLGTLGDLSKRAGTDKYSKDITTAFNEDSIMGKELKEVKERISTLSKKLTAMESRYYSQFTAMEQAINKMNSQSSSLASFAAQ